jgi:hypothetical protein
MNRYHQGKKRVLGWALFIIVFLFLAQISEAAVFKLRIKSASANIRLEPLLSSKVLFQAPQGAILESDIKTGEWFKVSLPPNIAGDIKFGYIHQSVIDILEEVKETPKEEKKEEKKIVEPEKPVIKEEVKETEDVAWSIQKEKTGARSGGTVAIEIEKGIKLGFNLSSLSTDLDHNYEMTSKTGFCIGGFLLFRMGGGLELEPGILFTMKGGKWEYSGTTYNYALIYKFNYLEIPVLVKMSVPLSKNVYPFFTGGPFLSLKMGAKGIAEITPKSGQPTEDEFETDIKFLDFGLIFGGGASMSLREKVKISLEIRYSLGLANIDKSEESFKTRNLLFVLGCSI